MAKHLFICFLSSFLSLLSTKGSTWASIKEKIKMKVKLKADYTHAGWKLSNKDGRNLEDAFVFLNDATIYATSKKNEITITVTGNEGVKLVDVKTFTADKGASLADIKKKALNIVVPKEDDVTNTYTAKWNRVSLPVTIKGDERLEVAEPSYIDVPRSNQKTF